MKKEKTKRRLPLFVYVARLFLAVYFTLFLFNYIPDLQKSIASRANHPARNVTRVLSQDEVAELPGGSPSNLGSRLNTKQVHFTSPKEKPYIQWNILSKFDEETEQFDNRTYNTPAVIDSEGGTWFGYGDWPEYQNLTKINPDGTTAWDFVPSSTITYVEPLMAVKGGVVCFLTRFQQFKIEKDAEFYFECFNLDGESIWRSSVDTLKFTSDELHQSYPYALTMMIRRIPDNRLMYPVEIDRFMELARYPFFMVVSLTDGEIIGFKNHFSWKQFGPTLFNDGSYSEPSPSKYRNLSYLTYFNPDKSIAWRNEDFLVSDNRGPIYHSDKYLLTHGTTSDTKNFTTTLKMINVETGNLIWSHSDGYKILGVSAKNHVFIEDYSNLTGTHEMAIIELNSDGTPIKAVSVNSLYPRDSIETTVFYDDGGILIATRDKLVMFDMDGNIYWNFVIDDEFPDHFFGGDVKLLPAPGNRIVIQAFSDYTHSQIISLGPKL